MVVGLLEGFRYPWSFAHQAYFAVLPSVKPQKSNPHSFENRLLVFSSSNSLYLPRLLVLFLLLKSNNVYPNSGLICSCSVCAGNVVWSGRPLQKSTCLKRVYSEWTFLSFSEFNSFSSYHLCSCSPCCISVFSESHQSNNSVSASSGLLSMYAFTTKDCKPIIHPHTNTSLPLNSAC